MKRRLMSFAGILNTLLFVGALGGSFYLIYIGGKTIVETIQAGLTNINPFSAVILVLGTLVTGVMFLIGIAATIFSAIMISNSKALIKKAKYPDEKFANFKKGIITYVVFCILTIGGCGWFLYSEIIKPVQNTTFVYILGGVVALLLLTTVLIIADLGKKINPTPTQTPEPAPTPTEIKPIEIKNEETKTDK